MVEIMNCPHDKSPLSPHKGINEGFHHCNRCGCCFDEDSNLRPGSLMCAEASGKQAVYDQSQLLKRISDLESREVNAVSQTQYSSVSEALETTEKENEALKAKIEELNNQIKEAEEKAKQPAQTQSQPQKQ